MNTTFLIAVFFSTLFTVGLSAVAVYFFAESKWDQHPLARFSHQRAASFASSY